MHMLNAKVVNDYLGTSYGLEWAMEQDLLLFDILLALKRGLNPEEKRGKL